MDRVGARRRQPLLCPADAAAGPVWRMPGIVSCPLDRIKFPGGSDYLTTRMGPLQMPAVVLPSRVPRAASPAWS